MKVDLKQRCAITIGPLGDILLLLKGALRMNNLTHLQYTHKNHGSFSSVGTHTQPANSKETNTCITSLEKNHNSCRAGESRLAFTNALHSRNNSLASHWPPTTSTHIVFSQMLMCALKFPRGFQLHPAALSVFTTFILLFVGPRTASSMCDRGIRSRQGERLSISRPCESTPWLSRGSVY